MKRMIPVWVAMVALCVTGTIYEFPNAVAGLRYVRNVFSSARRGGASVVPESVVARDPEAGGVLRYLLAHRYTDPNVPALRGLLRKYPENEFFLSRLAEGLMRHEEEQPEEAFAVVDRLQAVNPNNAHTRYLRAWVLLDAPESREHRDEILAEFEAADQLPEFYLPYGKYGDRIARLVAEAALPGHERTGIDAMMYAYLGIRVSSMAGWRGMDRESSRQLLASASIMAERVVENARHLESLRAGATLMEDVEKTRLKSLRLTEEEAWKARRRLGQAMAVDTLPLSMTLVDSWHSQVQLPVILGWVSLAAIAGLVSRVIFTRRKAWPDTQRLKLIHGLRGIPGAIMLIGLLAVLLLHRWRPVGWWAFLLLMLLWWLAMFSWVDFPDALLRLRVVESARSRQRPWRSWASFPLLWLSGTLLLLISNSGFFASGSLTGWSRNIGVFVAWSAFCVLLWLAMLRPRMSFRQPRRNLALAAAMHCAVALVAFDVFGAQRAYEGHVWANELSVYPRIPTATRQTYERIIRDSDPVHYREGEDEANALPAHIYYFTPQDMEAFLARRRAEGRPVSRWWLEDLAYDSAQDVRPVIRKALAELDAAAAPQPDSG